MGKFKTKYKGIVPSISHRRLTLRATLLKDTSRKGISKIARLKTGHSMLKGHKSKTDTETSLECSTYKVKETPRTFCFKLQRIRHRTSKTRKRYKGNLQKQLP